MSAIGLVVSDVDGTLVDPDKQLAAATVAAVKRLGAAGIGFTIISARPRSGMMPIADALSIDAPMAAFNGGLIFRRDGHVEAHDVIDPEAARGVIAEADGAAVDTWVFADDRWYATSGEGHHGVSERITADQEPVVRATFDDLLERADKITFVSDDPHLLGGLHDRCKARFGDRATIAQSQTYYLDVTALKANKGDGVTALAAALGIALGDTAAIGDQANDLPMLARAGLSIAMGNAPDAVKHQAMQTTRGNGEDGVAHAIDTLILARGEAAA